MQRLATIVLLVPALGACPPDLDRFRIEGEAGGEGEGEPADCTGLHLLVAVEDVSNTGASGRVLRFALREELPLPRCPDLTAGGEMVPQPLAVAWIDPHRVAVASTEAVQLVDPEDDSLTWTAAHSNLWPNDAFRLETPRGRRPAVAFSNFGMSSDIREVRVYDDAGGIAWDWLGNGGELPIGLGVTSMTQSPVHTDRMLALKPSDYAAAEIDPWSGTAALDPPYVTTHEGLVLDSIYALEAGGQNRLVWTGREQDVSHVYYERDTGGQGGFDISLPVDCEGRACTFVHAVPDPTLRTRLIGLCEEDQDFATRRIVRFRPSANECDVLFEAASLPDPQASRLARLSVAWEVGQ